MKKIVTLFIAVLLFTAVNAQDTKPDLLTLEAGWTSSSFTETELSVENTSGFYVGIRKDFKIVPLVRFNTGLLFTQQGTAYDIPSTDDLKMGYLHLPLGAKLKLGPIFLTGGVSPSFRLSANEGDENVGDDYKVFDLPAYGGIGVKVLMVSLDFRYHYGLLNISDNSNLDAQSQFFTLGLGFNIKR